MLTSRPPSSRRVGVGSPSDRLLKPPDASLTSSPLTILARALCFSFRVTTANSDPRFSAKHGIQIRWTTTVDNHTNSVSRSSPNPGLDTAIIGETPHSDSPDNFIRRRPPRTDRTRFRTVDRRFKSATHAATGRLHSLNHDTNLACRYSQSPLFRHHSPDCNSTGSFGEFGSRPSFSTRSNHLSRRLTGKAFPHQGHHLITCCELPPSRTRMPYSLR